MSTRDIPASREVTCDFCGVLLEPHGPGKYFHEGRVEIRANDEWTHRNTNYDCCDTCLKAVERAFEQLRKELKHD